MSLPGYIPKTKKALWVQIRDARAGACATPGAIKSRPGVKNAPQRNLRAKRVRLVSLKRLKSSVEYVHAAHAFMSEARQRGAVCPVFEALDSLTPAMQRMLCYNDGQHKSSKLNDVHHTAGRVGQLLTESSLWIAVSKWGHRVIHAFPAEARLRGWLCPVGAWNDYRRAMAWRAGSRE